MLYRSNERGKNGDCVMLRPITKEQEKEIDETEVYKLTHDGHEISITKVNILFYGEINLNNKEDVDIIRRKNLIDENLRYSQVPHDFDYKLGVGDRQQAPTNDPIQWFKFVHTRLGKPRRVIAYRIKENLA